MLADKLPAARGEELVDSVIRARGVCTFSFNLQRQQLFANRLLVSRPEDLFVEKPAPADPYAMPTQLEELTANTGNLFNIHCCFACDEEVPELENSSALHLYYIASEAMMNAARHSKATEITVSVARMQDRFVLKVQDNGVGFQPSGFSVVGMGIRIMRYHARVIGATLDLKSQPGQGTQVTCGFAPRETKRSQL